MNNIFDVSCVRYSNREGNLDVHTQAVVKSAKHFPYFIINNQKLIFKSQSKTKPFCTPLFSYSEVYWSYLLNHYFDEEIPRYKLAICKGIEEKKNQPKSREHGVLVPSIIDGDNKLVNLLEYYQSRKDAPFDLEYINYCGKLYDYRKILTSAPFIDNELGEQLAEQILYSYLRKDQNFHYENIAFQSKDKLAQPIDHEFSTPFLFPEDRNGFLGNMMINFDDEYEDEDSLLNKTINLIVKLYPSVSKAFALHLGKMITEIKENPIQLIDNGYLVPFSSLDFQIGQARYKAGNEKLANHCEEEIAKRRFSLDMDNFSFTLQSDTIKSGEQLLNAINKQIDKDKAYIKVKHGKRP